MHLYLIILFSLLLESSYAMEVLPDDSSDDNSSLQQVAGVSSSLQRRPSTTASFDGGNGCWELDNDNFPAYRACSARPAIQEKLKALLRLNIYNHVDESALDDEQSGDDWNVEYVFTYKYKEEVKALLQQAGSLRGLYFYNIPTLVPLLSQDLPFATSLSTLDFDYDTCIFDASISLDHLQGCSQFQNLDSLRIHAGVFSFSSQNEVVDFFSAFKMLKRLVIHHLESNKEFDIVSRSLSCLTNLTALELSFIGEMTLASLEPLFQVTSLTEVSVLSEFEQSQEEFITDWDSLSCKLGDLLMKWHKFTINGKPILSFNQSANSPQESLKECIYIV